MWRQLGREEAVVHTVGRVSVLTGWLGWLGQWHGALRLHTRNPRTARLLERVGGEGGCVESTPQCYEHASVRVLRWIGAASDPPRSVHPAV